jgi:hypothetical protein
MMPRPLDRRPVAAFLAAFFVSCSALPRVQALAASSCSGSLDSAMSSRLGYPYGGMGGDFSFGSEEYANLRLKARAGEHGTVHAAVNFIAAAGYFAVPSSSFAKAQGYATAIELERLYFRAAGSSLPFDIEAGLMRLAFGYGVAFSPTDFLSLRNPLVSEARPRGRLALAATVYLEDQDLRRGAGRAFRVRFPGKRVRHEPGLPFPVRESPAAVCPKEADQPFRVVRQDRGDRGFHD